MSVGGAQIEDLEIGVVVPSLLYAPIWIAERRGFLAEEGLSVKLRNFGTTERVTEALRDGVVPSRLDRRKVQFSMPWVAATYGSAPVSSTNRRFR